MVSLSLPHVLGHIIKYNSSPIGNVLKKVETQVFTVLKG